MSDLSPLDRLRLPVFSATTPLARDLTTHLGKGLDALGAQVSAMMEAVERVSAEWTDRPCLRRSYRQLSSTAARVADPVDFDLPERSSYAPDREISWVEGVELIRQTPVWVPQDLAITPPRDGLLHHVDTNGLAAGNTVLEAVVHGLCEVIERDAVSLAVFRSTYGGAHDGGLAARRIDPISLPTAAEPWVDRIRSLGLGLEIEHLETDVGVPVFRSVLVDHAFASADGESARRFVGFGAAPSAPAAAVRSLSEAVQSRVAMIHGARDSFNTVSPPWRHSTRRSHWRELESRECFPLATVPSFLTNDLRDDYRFLVTRLHEAGFDRIIAIDLSRRDFGFVVVRVRVPGLSSFIVDRSRISWRCLRYLL